MMNSGDSVITLSDSGCAMDNSLARQLKEAELSIAQAEKELGPEHPELADRLMKYAALLRQADRRALDAVNVEARAKAIRAKIYAAEAASEKATGNVLVIKPTKQTASSAIFGLAAVLLGMCSLFVDQSYFQLLAAGSLLLVVADIVATKSSAWWRALLALIFIGSAWTSMRSLPPSLLPNASPMERFTYASENPELVAEVRNLARPAVTLGYQLALPKGFAKQDEVTEDWGKMVTWKSETRPDGNAGEISLMVIRSRALLPPREYNKARTSNLAKEKVMPRIFQLYPMDQQEHEPPIPEDINGVEFERVNFREQSEENRRAGVVYVLKEQNHVVVVVGTDLEPYADELIPKLEASMVTFADRGGPSQL